MQKEDDYLDLTIAIWGEDGVGKRSLLERFLTTSRREQKDGITIYPCRSQYNGVLIDFTFVVISSTANIESPGVTEIINKAVASICCYSYIDYGSQSSLDHVKSFLFHHNQHK
jgi:GTPase SAR1 family protein